METLATFFVALVTLANTVVPQANLPGILGVSVLGDEAESSSTSAELPDGDVSVRSKDDIKRRLAQLRGERSDRLEEARQERKVASEEARLAREEAKEKAKEIREEFKVRLEALKDEKKKMTVEHIDERLARLNEKWTNHFNKKLTRLAEILAKIQGRTEALGAEGVDVAEVNAAIVEAEAAINTAQDAVNTQAGKTYIIEITDEENLGENVSQAIHALKADIKVVREEVRTAKQAVHDAFKALKEAAGEPDDNGEEEVTPTITPTP